MCRLPSLAALLLLSVAPTSAEVVLSMMDCAEFLLQQTPPHIPGILERGSILNQNRYKPICQTFKNRRRFVTLYDTQNKIPVFSASKYIKVHSSGRTGSTWKIEPQLENISNNHNMGPASRNQTYIYQAGNTDYIGQGFDRGHLFPCSYASTTDDKISTFTLTNIVPQEGKFNQDTWRRMETCVKCVLDAYCINSNGVKEGFLVIGARPGSNFMNNKVNIPSMLWSAFCCYSHSEMTWLAGAHWGRNLPPTQTHLQTKTLAELYHELRTANSASDVFPGAQCPLHTAVTHLYPKLNKNCECPPPVSATSAPPSTTSAPPFSTPEPLTATSGPLSTTSTLLTTTSGPLSTTSTPLTTTCFPPSTTSTPPTSTTGNATMTTSTPSTTAITTLSTTPPKTTGTTTLPVTTTSVVSTTIATHPTTTFPTTTKPQTSNIPTTTTTTTVPTTTTKTTTTTTRKKDEDKNKKKINQGNEGRPDGGGLGAGLTGLFGSVLSEMASLFAALGETGGVPLISLPPVNITPAPHPNNEQPVATTAPKTLMSVITTAVPPKVMTAAAAAAAAATSTGPPDSKSVEPTSPHKAATIPHQAVTIHPASTAQQSPAHAPTLLTITPQTTSATLAAVPSTPSDDGTTATTRTSTEPSPATATVSAVPQTAATTFSGITVPSDSTDPPLTLAPATANLAKMTAESLTSPASQSLPVASSNFSLNQTDAAAFQTTTASHPTFSVSQSNSTSPSIAHRLVSARSPPSPSAPPRSSSPPTVFNPPFPPSNSSILCPSQISVSHYYQNVLAYYQLLYHYQNN